MRYSHYYCYINQFFHTLYTPLTHFKNDLISFKQFPTWQCPFIHSCGKNCLRNKFVWHKWTSVHIFNLNCSMHIAVAFIPWLHITFLHFSFFIFFYFTNFRCTLQIFNFKNNNGSFSRMNKNILHTYILWHEVHSTNSLYYTILCCTHSTKL